MKYALVYTHRAERDIRGLDRKIKERIEKALLRYKKDPLRNADRLSDPRLGSYRFRIGDYRVVFDMEGNHIVVLRVGHRREVYRRS